MNIYRFSSTVLVVIAALLFAGQFAGAQELAFEGKVKAVSDDATRPLIDVMTSLAAAEIRSSGEDWVYVGYMVEARDSLRRASWRSHKSGTYRNVHVVDGVIFSGDVDGVEVAGSENKAILYKFTKNGGGASLSRIRILDMSDRYRLTVPLLWLSSADQARSLKALVNALDSGAGDRLAEDALPAVALHKGSEPKRMLKEVIFGKRALDLREDAVFWFGFTVDEGEIGELREMETSLDHPDLRERLAFVYYLQKSDAATTRMIYMARNDKDNDVREQAIFWLGQLAGDKIAEELENIVEDDPELEVKKQAVFALSQMETSESLDRLVRIAQTNPSPTVRKQALFWLSQSGDERAIDLLEQILMK
jgi:HEAT repeat protein